MKIGIPFLLFFLFIISCNSQDIKYKNYDLSIQDIIKGYEPVKDKISILIDKSDYKLSVLIDTIILKEYPVVFGKNPVDDKLKQGDKCTPEGTFGIISKYPHKKWSKFIWIDYPNEDSWQKHNKAKEDGKISENAKIGGEIGIHGVPEGLDFLIDTKFNWTLGCISMKNKDVDELYQYICETTQVVIKK